MAEAASRVNRQVDDTQEAFTDIKDLIPEEQRLEAAPPAGYDHQRDAATAPAPLAGEGYSEGRTYAIGPLSKAAGEAVFAAADPDDKGVPPALTFNQEAREIRGTEGLTWCQEAVGRIVDDGTVRYEAAKGERVARGHINMRYNIII